LFQDNIEYMPRPFCALESVKKISIVIGLSILAFGCGKAAPPLNFLSRSYLLGSFNQKQKPTWEYVTGEETVENWTTLITLIDRPEAKTMPELDRLAEGIMQTYKSNHGQILLARTIEPKAGARYNYLVAAFEEPAKRRYEVNFVKMGLGPKNAYIVVYGARVTDPQDYVAKGKQFLSQQSQEIGKALENVVLPDFSRLPRKEF
jgi:hypothetical protein